MIFYFRTSLILIVIKKSHHIGFSLLTENKVQSSHWNIGAKHSAILVELNQQKWSKKLGVYNVGFAQLWSFKWSVWYPSWIHFLDNDWIFLVLLPDYWIFIDTSLLVWTVFQITFKVKVFCEEFFRGVNRCVSLQIYTPNFFVSLVEISLYIMQLFSKKNWFC